MEFGEKTSLNPTNEISYLLFVLSLELRLLYFIGFYKPRRKGQNIKFVLQ